MQRRLRQRGFRRGRGGGSEDVGEQCKSCDTFQRTISKGRVPPVPLGKRPIIETLFSIVAIYIIGPLTRTDDDQRNILPVVDFATQYPEAITLKDISVETVSNALVSVYSRMGLPTEILTDKGRQFSGNCLKEVSRMLEIKHLFTTASHSMCNGLVESFDKAVKMMLRRMCQEQPNMWNRL